LCVLFEIKKNYQHRVVLGNLMARDKRSKNSEEIPLGFQTRCLHAGTRADPTTGARAVPIYQTASYVFQDTEHAAALFNLEDFDNIYSRMSNPTVSVFEERMASLEGGVAAVATASGQAAQFLTIASLCKSGDEILAASTLYGGTFTALDTTYRNFGYNAIFVDPDDPQNFKDAITSKTKLIYIETLANPRINIVDISTLAEIAHAANIPLVVDNTFATPYLCRPIEHGADIVVHSATKFLGGHGTSLGGVVVDSGNFDWTKGDFPQLNKPSPAYHGKCLTDMFPGIAFSSKIRLEALRDIGACLSPFNAFQIIQGIETLVPRMKMHCENALALVEYLEKHPLVNWVNFPGLKSSPYYEIGQRYLPKGAGAVFTFGIKGGMDAGCNFIESLKVFSHLANIGDAKSLIIHPASTTHQQLSADDKKSGGVTDDMIRVSVGLEEIEDLIADFDQAFEASQKPRARAKDRKNELMKRRVRRVHQEMMRWKEKNR
jgi:O-acetylhomoserine (thiol)-lyase